MQTLYEAIREGGSGMTRTQLMRLAYTSIKTLRGTRSSWRWIAARVERVHAKGVEDPIPSESDIDAGFARPSLGPVRSAYVRLAREEKEKARAMEEGNRKKMVVEMAGATADSAGKIASASLPAIRAGPERQPETRSIPGATPDEASQGSDVAPKTFFDNLQKLSKPST